MKRLAIILLLATPLFAATTRNDDSCDIGLYPAATLLLPYFEVDLAARSGTGEHTIFTITNTSPYAQAARVTLWTSFGYPVIAFNIFLTGYDVQKISLFDVIKLGRIAPDVDMGSASSPVGEHSVEDNPRLNEQSCTELPQELPEVVITRLQSAFTQGRIPERGEVPGCNTAGPASTNAVGYATVDVVGACTSTLPTDDDYFSHEIRFDNVLIGDYIQVNGDQEFAQGNPLVHIRAVPEGGMASSRRKSNLSRTFYSRLQHTANTRTLDSRQPLPAVFATRWISGGRGGFETFYKIWRESGGGPDVECLNFPQAASLAYTEITRFDEDENPESFAGSPATVPLHAPVIWPSSLVDANNESIMPPNTNGAVAGWMYFNLHNLKDGPALQNWIVTSMRAEDRFSVDMDAISLGNGCSAPVAYSTAVPEPKPGALPIGPLPNTTP